MLAGLSSKQNAVLMSAKYLLPLLLCFVRRKCTGNNIKTLIFGGIYIEIQTYINICTHEYIAELKILY